MNAQETWTINRPIRKMVVKKALCDAINAKHPYNQGKVNINDRHVHLVNGEHEEKDNDIENKKVQ